ncbi:MAG: Wzz/FepE/Etk N-terminal domain-containing protein [Pseudomonadota bacterium]
MSRLTLTPLTASAVTEETDMGSLSLLGVWRVLMARKRFLFALVAAFVLLAVYLSVRGEDQYTAEVLLVLEENNADLTDALSRDAAAYEDSRAAVEIFGSRRVLESVVDELTLTASPLFNPFLQAEADAPPPPPELVQQTAVAILESKIAFGVTPSDRLIRVTATTPDPDLSAQLANTVSGAFLSDLLNTRLQAVDGVVEQLGRRVVDLRQRVREKEQALQQFVNSVEFADPDTVEDRRASAMQIRGQIQRVEVDQAQTIAMLDEMDRMSTWGETEIAAAFVDNEDLARLAESFGTASSAGGISTLRPELEQQRDSNVQRLASLSKRLQELEGQIEEQSVHLLRYQQMEREVEASAEIYGFSVRRLNELSVQSGVESGGGRIVMPAEVPLFADSRGLARNIFFLGLLGLFTGVAWVLIRETTNHTLQYAEDVAPMFPQAKFVSVPGTPQGKWLMPAPDHRKMLLSSKAAPYVDAVQRLRSLLMLGRDAQAPLAINVTSDLNSTGKARLTLALARSFATLDKRVLVVDANTHRSGVMGEILKVAPSLANLQSMILGMSPIADTIHCDEALGVDFLLSDPKADSLGNHALVSEALPSIIDTFRVSYDVVLVDTVPLLASVEAPLSAENIDRTLFVVSLNESSRQSLADALKQHPQSRAKADLVAVYGGQNRQHRQYSEYEKKLARL